MTSRNLAVPPHLSNFPPDVVAAAIAADAKVKQILRDARSGPPAPPVTEQSAREGAALLIEFRRGTAAALARRIEGKELLNREELVERLGGNRRWVTVALKGERLFAVQAPSGVDYFPAFTPTPRLTAGHWARSPRCFPACPGLPSTTSLSASRSRLE